MIFGMKGGGDRGASDISVGELRELLAQLRQFSIAVGAKTAAADFKTLADVLGDRAQVQLGGTLEVVHPGLAEYRVESLRLHDLSIPTPMIPRILERLARGPRPSGVADDALPLTVPPYIGDVRIHDGKITLYKVVT